MSHYKPYPAYKDSGVEWLGKVPAHWEVFRIKSLISSSQNGFWGDEPKGDENDIPCARVADFDRSNLTVGDDLPTIRNVPAFQRESRQVCRGDLLFEKSGGGEQTLVGAVVHYTGEKPVICSNFVAVIKCKPSVSARWLCYANAYLYSVGVNIRSIKQATGIQNIDSEDYFSERISVPSEIEQGLIACYLDRETARIDGLIIRKNRFIELLREKRQALITHAVTKGLDPNAPKKDSGVEWLGDVPAHWDVCRLSFCVRLNPPEKPGLGLNDEVSFLPMEAIGTDGALNLDRTRLVAEVRAGYSYFEEGDIAFAKVTPCFENGKGAIMRNLVNGVGFGTTELTVLRPAINTNVDFLSYLIQSDRFRSFGAGAMTGAGGLKRVPDEFTRNFKTSWPDLAEQHAIAEYLDSVLNRMNMLISATESSIELLKERRSALITAAVTGQIDLRETV